MLIEERNSSLETLNLTPRDKEAEVLPLTNPLINLDFAGPAYNTRQRVRARDSGQRPLDVLTRFNNPIISEENLTNSEHTPLITQNELIALTSTSVQIQRLISVVPGFCETPHSPVREVFSAQQPRVFTSTPEYRHFNPVNPGFFPDQHSGYGTFQINRWLREGTLPNSLYRSYSEVLIGNPTSPSHTRTASEVSGRTSPGHSSRSSVGSISDFNLSPIDSFRSEPWVSKYTSINQVQIVNPENLHPNSPTSQTQLSYETQINPLDLANRINNVNKRTVSQTASSSTTLLSPPLSPRPNTPPITQTNTHSNTNRTNTSQNTLVKTTLGVNQTTTSHSSSTGYNQNTRSQFQPAVINFLRNRAINRQNMSSVVHPRVFTGDGTQDAYNHLRRFEALSDGNSWLNDAQKIRHFGAYLDDTAGSWWDLEGFDPLTNTWAEVKDSFLKAFDTGLPLSLDLKLQKRKMEENEPPIKYYRNVLDLCNRIDKNMSESNKLKELMKGLQPDTAQLVFMLNPTDCKDFWDKLQLVTQSKTFANNSVRIGDKTVGLVEGDKTNDKPLLDIVKALISEMSTLKDEMRRERERSLKNEINYPELCRHMARFLDGRFRPYQDPMTQNNGNRQNWTQRDNGRLGNFNRTTDARPVCYKCNRAGHIARFCRIPAQNQNQNNNTNTNENKENNRNTTNTKNY